MNQLGLVAVLATSASLFGLNTASAATIVTGSVERTSDAAYAFTSDNLQYEDGSAFGGTNLTLFCIEPSKDAPRNNTVYRFSEDPDGGLLSGGVKSAAALNWYVDTYYDSYFVNGTAGQQWAFQNGSWELAADYKGTQTSINPYSGQSRPGMDGTTLTGFRTAWKTIYADFGMALNGLSDDYRSSTYTLTYLDTPRNRQNLLAISEADPQLPAVPLPAAGWLLVGGIGALAAAKKRRS